jgi:hypothetical protein
MVNRNWQHRVNKTQDKDKQNKNVNWDLDDKMKNKNTVGIVPQSNIKIVKRGKSDTLNT